MINLTFAEILNVPTYLKKVVEVPMNDPMKAYALCKLIKKIDSEREVIVEALQKLVKDYSEEKEGNSVIPEEKRAEFEKKHEELMASELEIDFEPVHFDQFSDLKLTAIDCVNLEKFIVFE